MLILSYLRSRGLAALSLRNPRTVFSYSTNGGAKRGNQANTPEREERC